MGRARGTKRSASPAPGRGSWPPELRDLQSRGGMAPDWHDTWHGRGGGTGSIPTDPFPLATDEALRSLRSEPWSASRRFELLRRTNLQGRVGDDHPIIQALWENEWKRLQKMLSAISNETFEIDEEALRAEWVEALQVSLREAQRMHDPQRIRTSLLGFMIQPDTSLDPETREKLTEAVSHLHARLPMPYVREYLREEVMGAIRDFPWDSPLLPPSTDESFLDACKKAWAPGAGWAPSSETVLGDLEDAGIDLNAEEQTEFRRNFLEELSRLAYPPEEVEDHDKYYTNTSMSPQSLDRVEEALGRAVRNYLRNAVWKLHQEELEIGSEDLVPRFLKKIMGEKAFEECRSRFHSLEDMYKEMNAWWSSKADTSAWKEIPRQESTLGEVIEKKLRSASI